MVSIIKPLKNFSFLTVIITTFLGLLPSASSYVSNAHAFKISRDGEVKLECNLNCIIETILLCIFLLFFFAFIIIVLYDCYKKKSKDNKVKDVDT